MLRFIRNYWPIVTTSTIYFVFYFKYIFLGYILGPGDGQSFHYPAIAYLSEMLHVGKFPFYTERILSGFPVYAHSEFGYLNPIRIILAYGFNPINVIKIEHFLTYILGSIGMYLLCKKLNYSKISYIVANTVFMFSMQNTARIMHTDITYVYHLIPLCIYLLAELKHKWYFVGYISINLICIYYGNFNAVAISMMAQGIFAVSYLDIKSYLKNIFYAYWWIFIISIPLLLPAASLFLTASRNQTGITYTQGAVPGIYFLTINISPFLTGVPPKYIGEKIDKSWIFHENILYISISATIITFVTLLSTPDKSLKKFLITTIIISILLSTLSYLPYFSTHEVFPFSLFRYWVRFNIVLHFAIALTCAYFLSIKERAKIWLIPLLLVGTALIGINSYTSKVFVEHLINSFPTNILYLPLTLCIILLTFVFIYFQKLHKLLALLICFDVLFFSSIAFNTKIEPYKSLVIPTYIANENRRIVINDKGIKGNMWLYYPSWGLFGYLGAFEQQDYKQHLVKYNMVDSKPTITDAKTLEELGVNNMFSVENKELTILKNDEGYFKLKVQADKNIAVNTLVQDYKGWFVFDNKKLINHTKKDIYIRFELGAGEHEIEIKYIPVHLYAGIVLSVALASATLIINKFTQKYYR